MAPLAIWSYFITFMLLSVCHFVLNASLNKTLFLHISCSFLNTDMSILDTYPSLCYTSHKALAGTRNSSVGPP